MTSQTVARGAHAEGCGSTRALEDETKQCETKPAGGEIGVLCSGRDKAKAPHPQSTTVHIAHIAVTFKGEKPSHGHAFLTGLLATHPGCAHAN